MPDAASCETRDHVNAKFGGGTGGVLDFLSGSLADTLRIAIAPYVRWQYALVSLVNDRITNRLPNQVSADRIAFEIVFCQEVVTAFDIAIVTEGLIHVEVITPAGEFETVITPRRGFLCYRFERQISPLTRKKRNRTCHPISPYDEYFKRS
jgi:hypothetical protein